MAAILATVDIEDLATAKVKGIKDALTDLVQTQAQVAAASSGLTGSVSTTSAVLGSMADKAKANAEAMRQVAAAFTAASPVIQGTAAGIANFGLYMQQLGERMAAERATMQAMIGTMQSVAAAAQSGSAPIQLQAAALADLATAAKAGEAGLGPYTAQLTAFATQLAAGVPLTAAQSAELNKLAVEMTEANAATVLNVTAQQQLAQQAAQTTAAIRENYQTLTLLSGQLKEGSTVTKLQADAMKELQATFTAQGLTAYAETLGHLIDASAAGTKLTKEQAAALQELTKEYAEANKAALGLKEANEEHISTFEHWKVGAAAVAVVMVELAESALEFGKEAAQAAARTEVLGVVLQTVGKNANQNAADLLVSVERIKSLGITTDAAVTQLIKFTQAELSAADATKLARVAQDLAIVGNTNSSQAAETLTRAIESQSTRMLRQFGIVVNLNTVYSEYARQVGKTTKELDENDKKQAVLNTILEKGAKFAGTYEAAMAKVGKQFTSLSRLSEETTEVIGRGLLPIFSLWVHWLTEVYEWFLHLTEPIQRLTGAVIAFGGALAIIGAALLGAKLLGFLELVSKIGPAWEVATAAIAAARAVAATTTVSMTTLSGAVIVQTAEVGFLEAAWIGLRAAMGPVGAAITVIGVALALGTAAYTFFTSSQEETITKSVEHASTLQAEIDKITDAEAAIKKLTVTHGDHIEVLDKSEEGVKAYNEKVEALVMLVPGAVTGVDNLTGAFQVNFDAVHEATEGMKEYYAVMAASAQALLPKTEREYAEAVEAAKEAEKEHTEVKEKLNRAREEALKLSGRELYDAQQIIKQLEKNLETALKEYQEKMRSKAASEAKLEADKRLIASMNREAMAATLAQAAITDARTALQATVGTTKNLAAEMAKANLKEKFEYFAMGVKPVKELDAATGKYITTLKQMTADEIRKAGQGLQKIIDDAKTAQEAADKALAKSVAAGKKGVLDREKLDPKELGEYQTLETIFKGLTIGTEAWRKAIERHQPMLDRFMKSAALGKPEFSSLNQEIALTNRFMSTVVPQKTIDAFRELDAALVLNQDNTEEYQATLQRGAPLLEEWRNMTEQERVQLGKLSLVQDAATKGIKEYALEQQKLADQQKTREQLGQAQLELMDRYTDKLNEAIRAEEDAARSRRDANLAADEAIRSSRMEMQDDMARELLKGQELLDYQTQRAIQEATHRYEVEKKQRELSLQDEETATELKIRLAEEEIRQRIAGMTRLREFEIKMMEQAARDAELLAARLPGNKAAEQAAQDAKVRAEIARSGFAAYKAGLKEIEAEELLLQTATNRRLRDTVAANKQAAAEIDANQKALLDEQIAHILKLADAHTMAAEMVKKVWDTVAGAFSHSLFDMLKSGKAFTEGMKGLWENGLEPALKGVWENIRDSVFGIMEEMLKGWVTNLLKMKTATKAADIFGGAGGVAGGAGIFMSGQGSAAAGGVSPYAFGGKIQGGSIGRMGSVKAGAAGGVMGGVIGAQIGYGVGGQTGSYGKGIGAGAASGAAAGAAFGAAGGPVGAAIGAGIGAVIGGIGGWFGAKKAHAEARKARDEYIKGWEGGLAELQKKALEAGASLDAFNKAKTPEQVAKAIEDLNKAFVDFEKREALKKAKEELEKMKGALGVVARQAKEAGIDVQKLFDAKDIEEFNAELEKVQKALELHKAKEGLATTYAQMQALSKAAQLVGYDLRKLYDATTIEEFNDEQERLNKLLAEQKERLDALQSASTGLTTWATGFSQTLQKGFEDAFPKAAEVEDFYKKFKEAQDRGFKGTALDFSKQAKLALPMEEFVKVYQEAVDKGFKGTYEELAKHLQMPDSFLESLKKTAAGAQDEFQSLGITAAATFAAIVHETGDIVQAMNQIAPTLDQLIDAQDKWGLKADESFSSLIQFRRIIKDNQDVFNSISGLTQALKGLTDANALTEESFDAMGRTAVEKYNTLVARTGDAKLSLLSMQPTLQALWEAQKKFGFTVDDATQALIDQGIANGTVGANMQSVDQKMLDVLGLIAQALGVTKDKLDDLGVAGATAGGATADELERMKKAADEAALAGGTAGDDTTDAMAIAARRSAEAAAALAQLGVQGTAAGDLIKTGTDLAVVGLNSIIDRATIAQDRLFAMGVEGERAGRKIEIAAGGAAEGHSPTGIKAIVDRTLEAHAAMTDYTQHFVRGAQQIEDSAAAIAAIDMKPPTDAVRAVDDATRNVGLDTFPLDKFGSMLADLWQEQQAALGEKPVYVEPTTTVPEGAVTVEVTQEGATISVNALDNANMDEAWRNLIMPAYMKHLDNNADQIAERTESAIIRYRRRVG